MYQYAYTFDNLNNVIDYAINVATYMTKFKSQVSGRRVGREDSSVGLRVAGNGYLATRYGLDPGRWRVPQRDVSTQGPMPARAADCSKRT